MKAYDMSRHQRVIGTDGRISGTWVVLSAKSGEVLIKPHEVTIYDETRTYGRLLRPDSLTAWVRDGEVDVPKHMIREETRFEVEDAWDELIELLTLIAKAFFDGPRAPESGSADSQEADRG